ncbi:MAG TPA: hypothetical protein VHB77_02210 [Planctomycetaceae bacterium]|nr:hypothetical protein [Planctomycetaceae bacterium]
MSHPRLPLLFAIAVACSSLTGCALWPDALTPHNLWKLNRHSPPSGDPFISQTDKVQPQPIPLASKKDDSIALY